MIAALFVEKNGVYFGLPDVDPWDEERDARKYAGDSPVVAHPPCASWCMLVHVNKARYGKVIGDDDGCFESAVANVRRTGGVLEHPAHSIAWGRFGLPVPSKNGWTRMFASLVALHVAVANAAPAQPAKPAQTQQGKSGETGMIHVADCVDGKQYWARTDEHRGACSGHGGVAAWADGSPVKSHGKKTAYK